ncbi:hypothetical protein BSPWISOXPB_9937 [uncultured Gammaproteobacteria bacterium]|nr:hypothetical protein BSPWISOXPB_9937 [uncultured Gammaproteobacteria bacterium]
MGVNKVKYIIRISVASNWDFQEAGEGGIFVDNSSSRCTDGISS